MKKKHWRDAYHRLNDAVEMMLDARSRVSEKERKREGHEMHAANLNLHMAYNGAIDDLERAAEETT